MTYRSSMVIMLYIFIAFCTSNLRNYFHSFLVYKFRLSRITYVYLRFKINLRPTTWRIIVLTFYTFLSKTWHKKIREIVMLLKTTRSRRPSNGNRGRAKDGRLDNFSQRPWSDGLLPSRGRTLRFFRPFANRLLLISPRRLAFQCCSILGNGPISFAIIRLVEDPRRPPAARVLS